MSERKSQGRGEGWNTGGARGTEEWESEPRAAAEGRAGSKLRREEEGRHG
jgi:hypothetical protein